MGTKGGTLQFKCDLPNDYTIQGVINLRSFSPYPYLAKEYKRAKLIHLAEDVFDGHLTAHARMLSDLKVSIVCVSKWHVGQAKELLLEAFRRENTPFRVPVDYIYNCIPERYTPRDDSITDPNKLVYFSSPHKGLGHTLDVFKLLVNANPEFNGARLHVANPGYYGIDNFLNEDQKAIYNSDLVVKLGEMCSDEMMKELSTAWCVLHLNHVFPETMGIVYAEAQALGVPFLSHPLAAVPEMADHPDQLVDTRDPIAVIKRLKSWRKNGPPVVRANPEVMMNHVCARWEKALSA